MIIFLYIMFCTISEHNNVIYTLYDFSKVFNTSRGKVYISFFNCVWNVVSYLKIKHCCWGKLFYMYILQTFYIILKLLLDYRKTLKRLSASFKRNYTFLKIDLQIKLNSNWRLHMKYKKNLTRDKRKLLCRVNI